MSNFGCPTRRKPFALFIHYLYPDEISELLKAHSGIVVVREAVTFWMVNNPTQPDEVRLRPTKVIN